MIRTIQEHHQSYKRLIALAKKTPLQRREKLLQLARLNLKFAQIQFDDPSRRPDTKLRMCADQYLAISECLSAKSELAKRANHFHGMAEIAEHQQWPSSVIAPRLALTTEELEVVADASYTTQQRVFARPR
jgi:hypothetical protein